MDTMFQEAENYRHVDVQFYYMTPSEDPRALVRKAEVSEGNS